jgi:hypothetical protein
MGVLDDAIREHLDLKRQRGASEDEIARAEAEALGPARRAVPPSEDDDDVDRERVAGDLVALAEETRILDTPDESEDEDEDEVVPPPPPFGSDGPTHAVHDIDEDPLAPPPPVERAAAEPPEVEDAPVERGAAETPEVEDAPAEPPPLGRPSIDEPIRWPREKPSNRDNP